MSADWPAEMETPEAEPWKSRRPEASKACATKERWAPAGRLPRSPLRMPPESESSTEPVGRPAALAVTETREMEAAPE
jgi:hypothetical protein